MKAHQVSTPLARRSALALLGAALAAPSALAQPSRTNVVALPSAPSLPSARPQEVGLDPARLARIRPAIEREVAEGRLPGAVMMIARRGKLAYAETVGFRDRQQSVAMTPDTVFRLYSMTKPVASVAVMMLAEEGRVGLADPVGKFLPALDKLQVSTGAETVAAERPIRIYDLLRHTSGLAYGELTANAPVREAYVRAGLRAELDYDSRGPTPEAFVQGLAAAPLARTRASA